jgi:hypothetical protein
MMLLQTFIVLALLLEQGNAALSSPDSLLRARSSQRDLQSVGKIDKLRLIDADWDLPFELRNDGVPFDLQEGVTTFDTQYLNTRNWNIQAITSGTVRSVRFNYEGNITTENVRAWAMCGNTNKDFLVCPGLSDDTYIEITVTPYSGKNATGVKGRDFSVIIITGAPVPLYEPILYCINADTDQRMFRMRNNVTIDLSKTPNINFEAERIFERGVPVPKEMKFSYDMGAKTKVDSEAPYAAFGNAGSDFFSFTPTVGTHNIMATQQPDQGNPSSGPNLRFFVIAGK